RRGYGERRPQRVRETRPDAVAAGALHLSQSGRPLRAGVGTQPAAPRTDDSSGSGTAAATIRDSGARQGRRAARHSVLSTQYPFRWSIKVARVGFLDALEDTDVTDIDEIIIDIARDHPALLAERLDAWAARVGRGRIRLALPPLTRAWEDHGIRHKVERLR